MFKRSIPSPAMVIACLALFVAMGGTGYAATQLASGHEGAAASKAKKAKRGPRGPAGPAGKAGPAGPAGPAGAPGSNAFGALDYNQSAPVTVAPGAQDFVEVQCDAGQHPTGGGVYSSSGSPLASLNSSYPDNAGGEFGNTGWAGYANNESTNPETVRAFVVCAKVGTVTGP